VEVQASTESGGGPFLLGQLNERRKKVVLFTPDGRRGTAAAEAALQYVGHDGLPGEVRAGIVATLPRTSRLVVDYSAWSPKKRRGVVAYVKTGGRKRPVAVSFQR